MIFATFCFNLALYDLYVFVGEGLGLRAQSIRSS